MIRRKMHKLKIKLAKSKKGNATHDEGELDVSQKL